MKNTYKISIALGESYEAEAARLAETFSDLTRVTLETKGIVDDFGEDTFLNGFATKAAFGRFVPEDHKGPVLLMDADLRAVVENPAQHWTDPDADVAVVRYPGTWHIPPSTRKNHYDALGGKPNTGLVWFRTADIARQVSKLWAAEYIHRMKGSPERRNELDEWSLAQVLAAGSWSVAWLDPRWNAWPQGDAVPDAYLRQEHIAPEPPPPPLAAVKAWRIRAVAKLEGLHDAVLTAIDKMNDPQRTILKEAYLGDAEVNPDAPGTLALKAALGLSDEQFAALARQAAEIEV